MERFYKDFASFLSLIFVNSNQLLFLITNILLIMNIYLLFDISIQ